MKAMGLPDQKKRILYIITQPSPWGGAQRYVYDLATVLHRGGWAVTVAMGENPEGDLFQRLKEVGVPTRHLASLTRAVHPFKNISTINEIRTLCGALKPDIVHLNSSMAGVVGAIGARMAGIKKIVYTVHGLVTKEPLPAPIKALYWLTEWFAGKFRGTTICVSEDDRRTVIRQHIAPPNRTVTIPIGIDPALPFLSQDEARTKLFSLNPALDVKKKWIGTIAGLYKTKGLDTLIEAAHILNPIRHPDRSGGIPFGKLKAGSRQARDDRFTFLLIGEGPERTALELLIKRYELHSSIFLLGAIPDADRFMKAFDVFVLPSAKEGMPYAMLEALAAGVPAVSTNVGGIPEIFEGFRNEQSPACQRLSTMSDPNPNGQMKQKQRATHEEKAVAGRSNHVSPLSWKIVPPRETRMLANAIEEHITKEREVPPLSVKFPTIFTRSFMVERTINEYLRPPLRAP
jgi:glycosyltransferase involved in cell wall biosynthesis